MKFAVCPGATLWGPETGVILKVNFDWVGEFTVRVKGKVWLITPEEKSALMVYAPGGVPSEGETGAVVVMFRVTEVVVLPLAMGEAGVNEQSASAGRPEAQV